MIEADRHGRPSVARVAERVLGSLAVTRVAAMATRQRPRRLAFHGVSDRQRFAQVLDAALDTVKGDTGLLMITFDDGLASTVDLGLEPLRERGLTATLFVNPGLLMSDRTQWWDLSRAASADLARAACPELPPKADLTRFLKTVPDERRRAVLHALADLGVTAQPSVASEDELRSWLSAGMSIGNHTWDHPCLDMCSPEVQRSQICLAHDWLTEFLGHAPTDFAYPNGDWSPEAEQTLLDLGYRKAFLFDHRLGTASDPPLRQSRLRIDSACSVPRARAICSGAHSALLSAARPGLRKKPSSAVGANLETFDSDGLVNSYDPKAGLTIAERTLVEAWIPERSRVLDLGVGTGRTYPALASVASTYVGSDFAPAMVEKASATYPDATFLVIDAADLSRFDDASFDAVVFSYNGLDYLHPYSARSQALTEIRRVLAPGGVFIFSTHNPRAIVRLPTLGVSGWKPTIRAIAIAAIATARATKSLLFGKAFWRGRGYQMDRIQPLLTYYSTRDGLREELAQHGLRAIEQIAGDHPAPFASLSTAWTYVAAVNPLHPELVIRRAPLHQLSDDIATEWDRLSGATESSFFQTRAWVTAWSEFYGESESGSVLLAESDGRVVGLLPLASTRRTIHSKVPLRLTFDGIAGGGKGGADHLGPLAEDLGVGASLIAEAFRSAEQTLYLESLSSRWSAVAQQYGSRVRSTECFAATREPGASFSDNWSAKLKKNNRRRNRQLAELGITSRWVLPGPDFDNAVESLAGVHRSRWEGEGQGGMFDETRRSLIKRLASTCEGPAGPAILLMEQSGRAVAALLALRHRQTVSVYKTGWDPEFAKVGLGIALGVETMRWAEEHDYLTVDYLRGRKGHKVDLGCVPFSDSSVVGRRTPTGLLLELRERGSAGGHRPLGKR